MRPLRLLGPALIVGGVASLAWGYAQGEATLNLFLIFPVITATGGWSALGILLLIAGFFALFLTWSPAAPPERGVPSAPPAGAPPASAPPPAERRWGGVVFLGPVPIVFGSDAKVTKWMILVGALLFLGLVVLTVISLRGI